MAFVQCMCASVLSCHCCQLCVQWQCLHLKNNNSDTMGPFSSFYWPIKGLKKFSKLKYIDKYIMCVCIIFFFFFFFTSRGLIFIWGLHVIASVASIVEPALDYRRLCFLSTIGAFKPKNFCKWKFCSPSVIIDETHKVNRDHEAQVLIVSALWIMDGLQLIYHVERRDDIYIYIYIYDWKSKNML